MQFLYEQNGKIDSRDFTDGVKYQQYSKEKHNGNERSCLRLRYAGNDSKSLSDAKGVYSRRKEKVECHVDENEFDL